MTSENWKLLRDVMVRILDNQKRIMQELEYDFEKRWFNDEIDDTSNIIQQLKD